MFIMGRVRLTFFCTHIRIDSLLFGVLLSYFWHFTFTARHHEFFHRWRFALLIGGGALLAPMFFFEPFDPNEPWIRDYGFILCYVAGGMWVVAFMNIFEESRSMMARFFGFLGAHSYSVYLWHVMGIILGASLCAGYLTSASDWLVLCLVTHAAAWTIGLAAAGIVETPMLKLRDRWFPSKTSKQLNV
jgi:peptidoglycan/LPS O-acetylase OafA/YrhL